MKIWRSYVIVIVLLFASQVIAQSKQEDKDRLEDEKAWSALVKAKGGTEKLHAITNFLVLEYFDRAKGDVKATLNVLPDRYWMFVLDPFGKVHEPILTIMDGSSSTLRISLRRGLIDETYDYVIPEAYAEEQIVYLLETKYARPEPVRVRREKNGKRTLDVLECLFQGYKIEFFYETEEMLVNKVKTYIAKGDLFKTYEFSNYIDYNGIKMPTKQKVTSLQTWSNPMDYQFNVDFDPDIFAKPQKATTYDAWKRKVVNR